MVRNELGGASVVYLLDSLSIPEATPVNVLREHRRQLVSRQAKGLGAGWVFPSRVGKPHADPSAIRKPLAAALEAAGVGRWVSPHGLRRSFNNLVRQVAAGEVVRSMTGHVTEAMTEHHSHIELDEKRAAQEAALRLVVVAAPCAGGVRGGVSPEATKNPVEAAAPTGRNHNGSQ